MYNEYRPGHYSKLIIFILSNNTNVSVLFLHYTDILYHKNCIVDLISEYSFPVPRFFCFTCS